MTLFVNVKLCPKKLCPKKLCPIYFLKDGTGTALLKDTESDDGVVEENSVFEASNLEISSIPKT